MSTLSKVDATRRCAATRKQAVLNGSGHGAPFLDERDLVASDNVYETWRKAHGQPLGE
jgi:hypothetical protein